MSAETRNRRKKLRMLLERVVNILETTGKRYTILRFPSSYRERSIDLIAVGGDAADVIIRVKIGAGVSKDEAHDMLKASLALDSIPVVISDDPELYDNIIYEKSGVYVMNERTLENMYLKPTELIALYKKGELYLSVNREKLNEAMQRRLMSISELSYLTNISRRTVFKYKKEGGMVTVEKAEKLVSAVGEDVVESINFDIIAKDIQERMRELGSCLRKALSNPRLERRLREWGEVYDIRKSAPDYIVSGEEIQVVVDATPPSRNTLKDVVKKTVECVKLVDVVQREIKASVSVIASQENVSLVKDEISSYVNLNKVSIEKLE